MTTFAGTTQGTTVYLAYQAFQDSYNTQLPNRKQSFINLSQRAFKG